jgi:hypothetical protein
MVRMQITIPLNTTQEQAKRLHELQAAFAQACNSLIPIVRQTRIWNRVALHHLVYKSLRQSYPSLGSQMACNAIYSVSRTCRVLFQHPSSPFNINGKVGQPLPNIHFSESSPVYFDRHTLSIRQGQLSMFTLDGRLHFQLTLNAEQEQQFHQLKLKDIILRGSAAQNYQLTFTLGDIATGSPLQLAETEPAAIPEHILVLDAA